MFLLMQFQPKPASKLDPVSEAISAVTLKESTLVPDPSSIKETTPVPDDGEGEGN